MKQACSEFLEKQLDPSNCLGIRIFAENHSCESLRQASEAYTFKYFQEVIQHEEFRTLAIKDVEMLLKNDEIQVLLCYDSYLIQQITKCVVKSLNYIRALIVLKYQTLSSYLGLEREDMYEKAVKNNSLLLGNFVKIPKNVFLPFTRTQ